MQMLIIVHLNENLSFAKWEEVYLGDAEKRAKFMKDDMYGQASEKEVMLKFTVTDPEAMNAHMAASAPIFEELGIKHDVFVLTPAE